MRKVSWIVLGIGLVLSPLARAGECCPDAAKAAGCDAAKAGCCDAAKAAACDAAKAGSCEAAKAGCPKAAMAALIADWKTALDAEATMCPVARGQISADIVTLAKGCPTGSRMGETLAFAKTALEAVAASDVNCRCPEFEKGGCGTTECGAVAARVTTAKEMQQLVAFAMTAMERHMSAGSASGCAASTTASGSCAKSTEAAAAGSCSKAASAGASCAKSAEATVASTGAGCCPKGGEAAVAASKPCLKSLAARADALKASWGKVPGEYASMCPTKKAELLQTAKSLQQRSGTFALMPRTIDALAAGFKALDAAEGKVAELAKTNPALQARFCEATKASFAAESGVIREASGILAQVTSTFKAMEADAQTPPKVAQAAR